MTRSRRPRSATPHPKRKPQWVPTGRSRPGPLNESPTSAVGKAAVAADGGGAALAVGEAAVAADGGGAADAANVHRVSGEGECLCSLCEDGGSDKDEERQTHNTAVVSEFRDGDSVVTAETNWEESEGQGEVAVAT